ncbi:unnamed protein product [Prunus brigantina]
MVLLLLYHHKHLLMFLHKICLHNHILQHQFSSNTKSRQAWLVYHSRKGSSSHGPGFALELGLLWFEQYTDQD